jgi:tetratricopeptide (TPR) repeat protein
MEEEVDHLISRARGLVQLDRYPAAISELRKALAKEPDNYEALALLCGCYLDTKDAKESLVLAKKLVSSFPDDELGHYYLALAFDLSGDPVHAEVEVLEAIRINPYDADFFGFYSGLYIDKRNWEKGLDIANQGLELDPENLICLNNRTRCLTKLGRLNEMESSIENTLSADPDNWYSHANIGWSNLEAGNPSKAKTHFAEALRLDPTAEYAREGMREALKAQNFIYKMYLDYAFWIANKGDKTQWAIIIGFVVGRRILSSMADQYPILWVGVGLMFLFLYSIWIMAPLGDFLLLTDRFGRIVLTKDEKIAGWITGIGVLSGIVLATLGWALVDPPLIFIGGIMALLIIPLGRYFHEPEEGRTVFVKVYTVAITALAVFCIGDLFVRPESETAYIFLFGVAIYTWFYTFRGKS